MKIVVTNNSVMYNRGSEAVMRSVAYICRFWHPEAEIVMVTGKYGEILLQVEGVDRVEPRYDQNGKYSILIKEIENADYVLVTGADNYDGPTMNHLMKEINDIIFSSTSAKTILYDCSLEEKNLSEEKIADIGRFDVITVRETLTEELFRAVFGNEKVRLYPDPAFIMPMEECILPYGFDINNTVGINISNLIMGKSFGMPQEIVISNYKHLIDYILSDTKYNILFIQHVVNNGFDLEAINKLYHGFENEGRVQVLQSELINAKQIKYIISKLRLLVTARTHASIAAYSTNVPTFVFGYSIKSKGIAKDIFGEWEKYVLPVRSIKGESELLNKAKWLFENESKIRKILIRKMPEYKRKAMGFGECMF